MKAKCCRSAPRCAGCPVLAALAARRRPPLDEQASLVNWILAGPPPTLPPSVEAALAQLAGARESPRVHA